MSPKACPLGPQGIAGSSEPTTHGANCQPREDQKVSKQDQQVPSRERRSWEKRIESGVGKWIHNACSQISLLIL